VVLGRASIVATLGTGPTKAWGALASRTPHDTRIFDASQQCPGFGVDPEVLRFTAERKKRAGSAELRIGDSGQGQRRGVTTMWVRGQLYVRAATGYQQAKAGAMPRVILLAPPHGQKD